MASDLSVQSNVFRHQARQATERSPLYSDLCEHLAEDPRVADIVESPPRWDAPLRLLSGLHYLVLTGSASWDSIDQALVQHRDFLRGFVSTQHVQTNEVQRCWLLLPCFLEVSRMTGARSFDLVELGPSAGLNLVWDQYRYEYAAGTWGDSSARVALSGTERRRVPEELLQIRPRVVSRVGIDINPVDVSTKEGALRLKSLVWPDQTWRLELLDRAIRSFRELDPPPEILEGNLVELLPSVLAERSGDALTVVWQTAVLHYLSEEDRKGFRQILRTRGEQHPLAFVETSRPDTASDNYWGLFIELWPGGERRQVAYADFHGAWLDWLT